MSTLINILRTKKDLRQLYNILFHQGQSSNKLSILGVINSTLSDIWSYEAVVDNWPNFTSILLRPQLENVKKFPFKYRDIYVYSKNKWQFQNFIQLSKDILPQKFPYVISVCPVELTDILTEEVSKLGGNVESSGPKYTAYVAVKDDLKKLSAEMPLPVNITMGHVRKEDLEMIYSHWTSSRKTEKDYWLPMMKEMIRVNPNVCVFNEHGDAVSWGLVYLDNIIAMGYTFPKYRGLNVMTALTNNLVMQMESRQMSPYSYLATKMKTRYDESQGKKVKFLEEIDGEVFQFLHCS